MYKNQNEEAIQNFSHHAKKEQNIVVIGLSCSGKFGMRAGGIVFEGYPDQLTEKDIVDIYGKTKDWFLYGKTGY